MQTKKILQMYEDRMIRGPDMSNGGWCHKCIPQECPPISKCTTGCPGYPKSGTCCPGAPSSDPCCPYSYMDQCCGFGMGGMGGMGVMGGMGGGGMGMFAESDS